MLLGGVVHVPRDHWRQESHVRLLDGEPRQGGLTIQKVMLQLFDLERILGCREDCRGVREPPEAGRGFTHLVEAHILVLPPSVSSPELVNVRTIHGTSRPLQQIRLCLSMLATKQIWDALRG